MQIPMLRSTPLCRALIVCCSFFGCLLLGGAQARQFALGQSESLVLKESTEVVNVTVTVTNADQRAIAGLLPQQFELYEDKVKQQVEYFRQEDAPISAGIVFDVSGSMLGKIKRAGLALEAFVRASRKDDEFFLLGFNDSPILLARSTDGKTMLNRIGLLNAYGQTALYDAVNAGLSELRRSRHRKRVLLIISDGEDNASRQTFYDMRQRLREENVLVYCIGISEIKETAGATFDKRGKAILNNIARLTGSSAFYPRTAMELDEAMVQIALELRRQYNLGYSPTNPRRDGKWRKIQVRVNAPEERVRLTVRSREGYYAPKN